jgi:predicted nucleic acid-binding protein
LIADSSIWIDFFRGEKGDDIDFFELSLQEGRILMAPVVLSELLSSHRISEETEKFLLDLEFTEPKPGFWQKAGKLRRDLAKTGFHASLPDCLITQTCLEYRLPLLTRDQGIKKFGPKLGLTVLSL